MRRQTSSASGIRPASGGGTVKSWSRTPSASGWLATAGGFLRPDQAASQHFRLDLQIEHRRQAVGPVAADGFLQAAHHQVGGTQKLAGLER